MKTVLRILIILAASLVIAGVTLAAVNASGSASAQFAESGRGGNIPSGSGFGQGQASSGIVSGGDSTGSGSFAQGQAPSGFGPGAGRGEMDRGRSSGGETVKNLLVIVVIVVVVVLFERLLRAIRKKKAAPLPVDVEQPVQKE
jgi:hypothetical protein